MGWKVEFSTFAQRQLRKLDRPVAKRILEWLDERIEGAKDPRHFGEPLKGGLDGLWRYRIGDFRLIFELRDDRMIVLVIAVGHRREVYRRK